MIDVIPISLKFRVDFAFHALRVHYDLTAEKGKRFGIQVNSQNSPEIEIELHLATRARSHTIKTKYVIGSTVQIDENVLSRKHDKVEILKFERGRRRNHQDWFV